MHAFKAVVRQLTDNLSSSKIARIAAETDRDGLIAKLEARKERKPDEFAAKIAANTSKGEKVGVEDAITEVEVFVEEAESKPKGLKELLSITQYSKWQKKPNVILMPKRKEERIQGSVVGQRDGDEKGWIICLAQREHGLQLKSNVTGCKTAKLETREETGREISRNYQ